MAIYSAICSLFSATVPFPEIPAFWESVPDPVGCVDPYGEIQIWVLIFQSTGSAYLWAASKDPIPHFMPKLIGYMRIMHYQQREAKS